MVGSGGRDSLLGIHGKPCLLACAPTRVIILVSEGHGTLPGGVGLLCEGSGTLDRAFHPVSRTAAIHPLSRPVGRLGKPVGDAVHRVAAGEDGGVVVAVANPAFMTGSHRRHAGVCVLGKSRVRRTGEIVQLLVAHAGSFGCWLVVLKPSEITRLSLCRRWHDPILHLSRAQYPNVNYRSLFLLQSLHSRVYDVLRPT